MIVIIGGSGFYDFLDNASRDQISTPFGEVHFDRGKLDERDVIFIPRHGKGHKYPPSLINYRANIYAAHLLEAEMILTTNAVGSMQEELGPGTLAVPDQIIDFTSNREHTFFDGSDFTITTNKGRLLEGVVHTDVTNPYDVDIRQLILSNASGLDLKIHDGGTMAVYNGPRYETKAEVQMAKQLGGDFAGMTSAPEAFLAKEIDLPYATVAVVTNFAAGMQESVSHAEVEEIFGQNIETIKSLFARIISSTPRSD